MHKNRAENFAPKKTRKKRKTHPKSSEKGETGCVSGAGGRCSRCERVREPEVRTKMHHIAMQHMKKANRRKPSVFAGFVAGAEGLEPSARGFGVDVGERTREREMGGVARFPPQVTKQAVLVWCCEHFWEAEPTKSVKMLSKNSFIFLAYLSSYRTVKYLFFY